MPDHHIIRLLLLSCAATTMLFIGCDPGTNGDITPISDPGFGHRTQTISADTDHVTTTRPITITTHCLPLVNGKGRILMFAQRGQPLGRIRFLDPVDTTVIGHGSPDSLNRITYLLEYHANEPLQTNWHVLLPDKDDGYGFDCTFVIDSLKLDDGRMVSILSDEANAHAPKGHGYERYGSTEPSQIALEP